MKRFNGIAQGIWLGILIAVSLGTDALTAERPLSAEAARGKMIYEERCVHCHQKQFWAGNRIRQRMGDQYAPLDQRTDLNAAYIHQALRRGVGSMIPYRRTELSDAEIDALAAYLTRRSSGKAPNR